MEFTHRLRISTALLITATAFSFSASADNDNPPPPPPPSVSGGSLYPVHGSKKRIPSLERIYYYYDGEQLEFEPNFEYSALYVTVESEQTHRVWTGTATPDAPSVSAPDQPGTYVITTVTDQGKTFSGYLNL